MVIIQVRQDGPNLHIQGKGPIVNRNYGVACTVTSHPEVTKSLKSLTFNLPSLAKSNKRYIMAEAFPYPKIESSVRLRIKGDSDISFIIRSLDLSKFVEKVTIDATNN